ncbi:NUDIX hydrolase [Alteracholeplasma palmae J233]|uniref:NUDIX hydrolase n=1 Tax=Alteracholeplasma palmae (strain ATCC 49389 / J233) TaxID=1318466 RepID=U4KSH0_ALTPJ|nr:NUDIX domain-containing protein [Alteracholeplasma palmae]CCV65001.1 NUDIX hydrolase [Alteracholeplasma palmae J233]
MFNYDLSIGTNSIKKKIDRSAVRAVILRGTKILVLKSDNEEVKLPGGGVEVNETAYDALRREIKEETGYNISKYKVFGVITVTAPSQDNKSVLFSMKSDYFLVEVENKKGQTSLQGYEIDLNFKAEFIEINDAIKINEKAIKNNNLNEIAHRELIALYEVKKLVFDAS